MESNLQGEDIMTMEKDRKKEIEAATEIVVAIDHWLEMWPEKIDKKVGSLIQNTAMKELAFMRYLNDDYIGMDELRVMANDKLEEFGGLRIPRPILPVYPFPTHTMTMPPPKKTRREELEGMTYDEIQKLSQEVSRKETKANRIKCILKAEKDYK
jgi:hypothetical protein